jgi:hypothetical protein
LNLVDHINGVKLDNRWCNLRDATYAMNSHNLQKANSKSITGILGVQKTGRGFCAIVGLNNKSYYSPTYDTEIEAKAAYLAMKKILHIGFVDKS